MKSRRNWLVGLLLFLVTVCLYWPATHFPFVNYDDQLYVYENPEVLKGLTWGGIKWAATTAVCDNWLPVTQISHMADCSLFGLFAGGHHLTSILLHAVNTVLLWLLLTRLTGSFWPSAWVAALFAWHPLNVESVTWIAERNNVLSTFFFILTVWAYLAYVRNPRPAPFALALILFALGLAAKPMLVTLPFLLLLLDYWPLRRISFDPNLATQLRQRQTWNLLLEKIPFLVLSLADCVITFVVQNRGGALRSLAQYPLWLRLLHVPLAYAAYVAKAFWPVKLCPFYSYPEKFPVLTALNSPALLLVAIFAVWHWKSKFRWLFVGSFWFLGTLIPVIGLVQTGDMALADRYAYLPFIGLFVIVSFGLESCVTALADPDTAPNLRTTGCCITQDPLTNNGTHPIAVPVGRERVRLPKILAASGCALTVRSALRVFIIDLATISVGACLILSRRQLMCWRDSVALFTQTVAVNPENAGAQNLLGRAFSGSGQPAEALEHFAAATRLAPQAANYQYDLGRALIDANRFSEAGTHLALALAQMPDNPTLHNAYGVALMETGQTGEAERKFSQATKLQPNYSMPYFNLGKLLLSDGKYPAAIDNLNNALRLEPDWPEALENLARAYAATGNQSNALATAKLALNAALAAHQTALAARITNELNAFQNAKTPPAAKP